MTYDEWLEALAEVLRKSNHDIPFNSFTSAELAEMFNSGFTPMDAYLAKLESLDEAA